MMEIKQVAIEKNIRWENRFNRKLKEKHKKIKIMVGIYAVFNWIARANKKQAHKYNSIFFRRFKLLSL